MITAVTVKVTRIDNMDVKIVYEHGAHIIHIYSYLGKTR